MSKDLGGVFPVLDQQPLDTGELWKLLKGLMRKIMFC